MSNVAVDNHRQVQVYSYKADTVSNYRYVTVGNCYKLTYFAYFLPIMLCSGAQIFDLLLLNIVLT